MKETQSILEAAKRVSPLVNRLSTEEKNRALEAMAEALLQNKEEILAANRRDLAEAEGKISPVMLDRLRLTEERIGAMAEGIRTLVALPDPVGRVLRESTHEKEKSKRE